MLHSMCCLRWNPGQIRWTSAVCIGWCSDWIRIHICEKRRPSVAQCIFVCRKLKRHRHDINWHRECVWSVGSFEFLFWIKLNWIELHLLGFIWKRVLETSVWESSKVHTMRHIESHTATNCHAQHAKILTDRSPWTSSVWLWYLSGFSMIGQIGDNVLQHLRSRTFLHPGKFRCRIRCTFAIHHFCQQPFSVRDQMEHFY